MTTQQIMPGMEVSENKPAPTIHREITIRLAQNEDGWKLKDLGEQCGFVFDGWDIDWSDSYPYWLLAEADGDHVGMINVCPGKPFGRLEIMCVSPTVTQRERGEVTKLLVLQGQATLITYGCQGILGMIAFENKGFKRVAKRRGYRVITSGNLMIKRLK